MGVTYDTGALLAAEADRVDLRALHRESLRSQVRPVVPAPVLAQAWHGGPQHNLSRLLRGCDVEPVSEDHAREAGRACGVAGTSDVVDAAVVVLGLARDDLVVTSDEDDLRHLAAALGRRLKIHRI
jgi:hypothetical protein